MLKKLTDHEFDQLFLETLNMIYNLGYRLFSGKEEDINDFIQDVYLHSFKKRHSFKGKSKFSTWLYSLALNLGLSTIKKQKMRRLKLEKHEKDISEFTISQSNYSQQALDSILENETSEIIQTELYQLPEAYRITLILYYYENLTYTEIAKKLSFKEGTVKSHIHRGKQILKNKLKNTIFQDTIK